MVRKTVSIKFDPELWKKVKIHCVTEEKEISQYLEEIVRKDLD
jgi:hypothetical protein